MLARKEPIIQLFLYSPKNINSHVYLFVFFRCLMKQGYFYRNQYIGKDPGNLFAATTCCTGSCFGGAQSEPIASDEEIR